MFRKFSISFILTFMFSMVALYSMEAPTVINIDAGESTTLCYGEPLDITLLGSSISGDVSDGTWFTQGDGVFLPSGNNQGTFSTTTQYQPGPLDMQSGSFKLILVSDDPDGNGPMVEVTDMVTISFMNAPALVCNNSINVSLAESCEQQVDIFMLVANPTAPYDKYSIEVFDASGAIIEDNVLFAEHIGTDVTFKVSHDCTNSFCDGDISVSDNIAPFLNCIPLTVNCEDGVSPLSSGLPIPIYATATQTGDYTFDVENLDACSTVVLSYSDDVEELNCGGTGYISEITRTWHAEDASGNSSSCQQMILVKPLPLDSVSMPGNYDGNANPPLVCNGLWEKLDNGYPSPSATGTPAFPNCGNIQSSYTDALFDECGAGFKIVRQWFVIDWCTTESLNHNQIIKILDQEAPVFNCSDDLTVSTGAYTCTNKTTDLEFTPTVTDCSDYTTSFGVQDTNGMSLTHLYIDGNTLSGLPLGSYDLLYIAEDVCGNRDTCSSALEVIDNTAPFAVCDGYTKIGLSENGMADLYATSVDDNSLDNCGSITMEIAKMTDECGWGLEFGDKVRFCCEEVGDTVMVAFRVTDEAGLSNTCMVTVHIEDKLPPALECPSDLTLSCQVPINPDDLDDYGIVAQGTSSPGPIFVDGVVVGQSGYFYDNCNATLEVETNSDIECGNGTIKRTFTVTDDYGGSESCTQTITIVNDDPFLSTDILWPANFNMNGCDTIEAIPTIAGQPIFLGDKCALTASTYEDQVFYISGGACIKILRTWTVIDWCQFNADTGNGLWTSIQEIKLKNTVAPQIFNCEDIEVCSYDEDCMSELVTITALANDDCTDSLNLTYQWSLDVDDNGTIDEEGSGISFDRVLELGLHRVHWLVEDGCGNTTSCNYRIDVRDCKNPTPYCLSSITTTVMPSTGSIDIWASDFNYGSYDNCTDSLDLEYSFSADVNDKSRTITCDSIANGVAQLFELQMWVTDSWGNQEYCTVSFIVQDIGDACENIGTIKGQIKGRVATQRDKSIPNVEISIDASIDTFSNEQMTDGSGIFKSTSPEYLKYALRPSYSSKAKDGVSTLDLVLIQQHILGITPFDNPYDLIASDVSKNERLTSSDLLVMRKMILGIITEWPKNQAPWAFVDSAYVFPDEGDPFLYPDSIVISHLMDTTKAVKFIAVKIGDVNGSFNPLQEQHGVSDVRNDNRVSAIWKTAKDERQLYLDVNDVVDGVQMSLDLPQGAVVESEFLADEDYYISENSMTISWVNMTNTSLRDIPFFTIRSTYISDEVAVNDELNAELYIDLEPFAIDFKEATGCTSTQGGLITVKGNPFANDLVIENQFDRDIEFELRDVTGQRIFQGSILKHGTITINEDYFDKIGLYILTYADHGRVQKIKLVKL